MESWKLKELEELVLNNHGHTYAENIHEPLQSFHLKSMMAFYHAEEYQRIFKEMLDSFKKNKSNISDTDAAWIAIFEGISDESKGAKIMEAKFKAEAHLIASAQALHSLFDIMATIVYWALKLDSYQNKPSKNRIHLYSVRKSLTENSIYDKTHKSIDSITSSAEYEYLAAYVNTTKHKSLIPSSLSVASFGEKNGLLLKEFDYLDFNNTQKHFGKKWSQDFILVDSQKLRSELLTCGNTLNTYLK